MRTIYVGACLPSSCSTEDAKKLAKNSHYALESRQINILDVRVPTDREFNIFDDRTFWILL